MIPTSRIILVLLFGVLTAASPLHACVCPESGTVEQQIKTAQIAVVGKVIGLTVGTTDVDGQKIEFTVVTLAVEQRWKGPKTTKIQVSTCGTQALLCTCGFHFQLGGRYIVVTEEEDRLSSCGLTTEYWPESPLLAKLDSIFKTHLAAPPN